MIRRMVCVCTLLAVAGCGGRSDDESAAADVRVKVAVAVTMTMPDEVSAAGMVTPRPGHVAELSAPAATRVSNVPVTAGQQVRAGDVLVEFERAPFAAQAHSAETAVQSAQAAFDRAARLVQAGVIPRKDLDQATTDLAAAQAGLVSANRALELASLRSPIAGVVTRMDAVLGQPVDANQALVQVVDQDALDVVLAVTPDAASRIRAGAAVTVRSGARSETLGAGRVATVAGAVDSVTRAVPVRVALERPARALRIGEAVEGRIVVGAHRNAVTIPAVALVPEGEGFRVFVLEQGLARARDVTVGVRTDSLVEITGGIAAGDSVVTYGAYGLEDSVKVTRSP